MPDFPLLNGQVFWVRVSQGQSGSSFVIGFETYIYWSCDIGQEFADALAEGSRHGVKVHMLLDWVSGA